MSDQRELSSSVSGDNEDEIEKDAEKAYRNMSVEARVFGNLVTGVDDEEFEHVWQDETCHSQINTKKQTSVNDKREEVYSGSSDVRRDSVADSSGILSPSSLAGFQTVSLSALPGSRLKIERYGCTRMTIRANQVIYANLHFNISFIYIFFIYMKE